MRRPIKIAAAHNRGRYGSIVDAAGRSDSTDAAFPIGGTVRVAAFTPAVANIKKAATHPISDRLPVEYSPVALR